MNQNLHDFKFLKVKNGKPFFAIINMDVIESKKENKIIENYNGLRFQSQGYLESVPKQGYENWKNALRKGLEFILEKSDKFWEININAIEGRIGTDTNATIVGYVAILAFCSKTGIKLDNETTLKLENFVFNSWDKKDDFETPNYERMSYE